MRTDSSSASDGAHGAPYNFYSLLPPAGEGALTKAHRRLRLALRLNIFAT